MNNIKISAMLIILILISTGCKLERGNAYDPESSSYIADTIIPLVTSFSIFSGSEEVEPDISMTTLFSEAMDTASVESAFSLVAGSHVSGSFEWSNDKKTVTFTPASDLCLYEDYTASFSSAANDIHGNGIAALTNIFTTRGPVGVLDESFDEDGKVAYKTYSVKTEGYATVLDSEGRIMVTGRYDDDMCIWRYNADGSLDTTFGGTGYVKHSNAAGGSGVDVGMGIALDSDGRIFVAGYSTNSSGNKDMVTWCYTSEGILNVYHFGSDGYLVYTGSGGGDDIGCAVTVDDSGYIYVAGAADFGTGYPKMTLWKYAWNGSDVFLKSDTYSTGGGQDGRACGTAIELDSNGSVVVAGYCHSSSDHSDIVVWRYLSGGTADTSFSGGGILTSSGVVGGIGVDQAYDLYINSDDEIFVTGCVDIHFTEYGGGDANGMVIMKIKENGTFDSDFNSDGCITHQISELNGDQSRGTSIAVDASGKILVAGEHGNDVATSNNDCMLTLWRYNADGSLDTGFNGQGWLESDDVVTFAYSEFTPEILIGDDSKINIIGFKRNSSSMHDMTIWRYE